jgi:hypothetical protein
VVPMLSHRTALRTQKDRRMLIVVGAYGAFVAAFRNRLNIVLAHINRQSPRPAASALSKYIAPLARVHRLSKAVPASKLQMPQI